MHNTSIGSYKYLHVTPAHLPTQHPYLDTPHWMPICHICKCSCMMSLHKTSMLHASNLVSMAQVAHDVQPSRPIKTIDNLHPSLQICHKEASSKAPCQGGAAASYQGPCTNPSPRLSIEKVGPGSFIPDSHPPMYQIGTMSSSICAQPQPPHYTPKLPKLVFHQLKVIYAHNILAKLDYASQIPTCIILSNHCL